MGDAYYHRLKRKERCEAYLGVTPFEVMLHDRSKHLASLRHSLAPENGRDRSQVSTHDSAHRWLASSEFGKNMLHHELLHAPLDLGMAHDEWAKR